MSKILVNELAHTNDTTALTVDSTGRILTPARPAFHVRYSAGSAAGIQGDIVFNEEDFDIGNNYDTSNGRFTAPVAGVYYFCFDSLVANDTSNSALGDGSNLKVRFHKNGSAGSFSQRSYYRVDGATQYNTIFRTDCIQLAANDYIQVNVAEKYIYTDTTGNYDPTFQGFLLG